MSKKKTSIAWTNIHVLYGRRIWTLVKNMYNENKSLTKDELLIEIEKNILVLFDEIRSKIGTEDEYESVLTLYRYYEEKEIYNKVLIKEFNDEYSKFREGVYDLIH